MLQFITGQIQLQVAQQKSRWWKVTELTIRGPFKSFGDLHIVYNIGLNAVAAPLDLHTVILSVPSNCKEIFLLSLR